MGNQEYDRERSTSPTGESSERSLTTKYIIGPLQMDMLAAYTHIMTTGIVGIGHANPQSVAERTLDYYQKGIDDPTWTLLVATDPKGGAVVGGLEAQFSPDGRAGRIQWVCTDPKLQRTGVATALYTEYEDILKARGAQYMWAAIHDGNSSSLHFHESFGFNIQDPLFPTGRNMKLYYKRLR